MLTRAGACLSFVLAVGALTAGCYSPGSLCQGTVDRVNALYDRCGYPAQVQLVLDGMPRECGAVNRAGDPDMIVYTCWPWLENVACEDLMEGDPGLPQLDPSCDFGQFTAY
jgi:hypothetical protein